jgi:hypothetical protein
MHENLAEIARLWVASTILTGQVHLPTMPELSDPPSGTTTQISRPSSLISSSPPSSTDEPLSPHPVSPPLPSSTTVVSWPSMKPPRPIPSTKVIESRSHTKSLPSLRQKHPSMPHIKRSTAFHDRLQPKITSYLQITSTSIEITKGTSPQSNTHQLAPKRSSTKKKTTRQCIPTPTPSLFDSPILPASSPPVVNNPPPWGHALESIDPSTRRIILQNPNGIKPIPSDLDFQYSLSACHEIGGEILCLPETNTS